MKVLPYKPELPPSDPFESFNRGDRVRFVTWRRHVGGYRIGMVWRTGTVQVRTNKSVTIQCDVPNPIGHRAVLTKTDWAQRCATHIA